mgnify:FL=1
MKNILISCVGGMLTYDFVRSLRENTEFKFKLIGIDSDEKAYNKVLCDHFYKSPKVRDKEIYFNFIKKIVKKDKIDFIFPLSDDENRFFFEYKNKFIKVFPNLKLPSEIQNIFLSKEKLYNFCAQNSINVNNFEIIKNLNELKKKLKNKKKKFILKQSIGHGSNDTYLINNNKKNVTKLLASRSCYELNAFNLFKLLKKRKGMILTDYYKSDIYDVDCLSKKGKVLLIVVRKRLLKNSFLNYSTGHQIVKIKKIENLIKKFVKNCNYTGISDYDVIESKGKFMIMDASSRFSGSVGASLLAGVNFPLECIKMHYGKKISKPKIDYNLIIKTFMSFAENNKENYIEKYIPKFENQIKI